MEWGGVQRAVVRDGGDAWIGTGVRGWSGAEGGGVAARERSGRWSRAGALPCPSHLLSLPPSPSPSSPRAAPPSAWALGDSQKVRGLPSFSRPPSQPRPRLRPRRGLRAAAAPFDSPRVSVVPVPSDLLCSAHCPSSLVPSALPTARPLLFPLVHPPTPSLPGPSATGIAYHSLSCLALPTCLLTAALHCATPSCRASLLRWVASHNGGSETVEAVCQEEGEDARREEERARRCR